MTERKATERTKKPLFDVELASECEAISEILSRVGDKWTVLVISSLGGGPRRYADLRKALGSISNRMLTVTLRHLERDGLVTRTVLPTVPPRVDYKLTRLGSSLFKTVVAIAKWVRKHRRAVENARARFDSVSVRK